MPIAEAARAEPPQDGRIDARAAGAQEPRRTGGVEETAARSEANGARQQAAVDAEKQRQGAAARAAETGGAFPEDGEWRIPGEWRPASTRVFCHSASPFSFYMDFPSRGTHFSGE
jgi:hypothetical protein